MIKAIKGFGLTFDTFFELWQGRETACNLTETIENKVAQIDANIRRLTELRDRLTSSMVKCKAGDCEFDKAVPSCVRD